MPSPLRRPPPPSSVLVPWTAIVLLIIALFVSTAFAEDTQPDGVSENKTIVLVANPGLMVAPYSSAMVIVGAIPNNRHLGVIVNHPIGVALNQILPSDHAGKASTRPVNLGGPEMMNALFAVVSADRRPDRSGVPLGGDLYLVGEAQTVDELITRDAPDARYFVGLVMWDTGELDAEVAQGLWSFAAVDVQELMKALPERPTPSTGGSTARSPAPDLI